jgi:hypothetical protein
MTKSQKVVLIVCLLLLGFANVKSIYAGQMLGFIGSSVPLKNVDLNNGRIETGWNDATHYLDLPEYGPNGQAKFANNGTHLFALFTTTLDQEWVAVEFNAQEADCMYGSNDAWTFYINEQSGVVEAQDGSMDGRDYPNIDGQNDLLFETEITDDMIQIEVVRKFDTGDTTGNDVVFQNDTDGSGVVYLMFASKSDHYSDRTIYYLSVQVSETGGVRDLLIMEGRDWDKFQMIILQLGIFAVVGFITIHFTVRGILRPLKHGSRIVGSDYRPPTFKERMHEISAPSKNGKPSMDKRVSEKRS